MVRSGRGQVMFNPRVFRFSCEKRIVEIVLDISMEHVYNAYKTRIAVVRVSFRCIRQTFGFSTYVLPVYAITTKLSFI